MNITWYHRKFQSKGLIYMFEGGRHKWDHTRHDALVLWDNTHTIKWLWMEDKGGY